VDRPLTLPRHWRRNATRLVKVNLHEGDPIEGRIADSDDDGVTLDVAGAPDGTVRIAFADVSKAKIQIEFKREG
jgi:ribosome maturation factor RimP